MNLSATDSNLCISENAKIFLSKKLTVNSVLTLKCQFVDLTEEIILTNVSAPVKEPAENILKEDALLNNLVQDAEESSTEFVDKMEKPSITCVSLNVLESQSFIKDTVTSVLKEFKLVLNFNSELLTPLNKFPNNLRS